MLRDPLKRKASFLKNLFLFSFLLKKNKTLLKIRLSHNQYVIKKQYLVLIYTYFIAYLKIIS